MRLSFSFSSSLAAPRAAVWARVATMAGVNDELAPLARMTHPREAAAQSLESVPLGRPAFRSWGLLFGVLLVEYDDVTLVQVEPGRGFREESPLLTQRPWIHERRIEDLPGGCRLTDRLSFGRAWRYSARCSRSSSGSSSATAIGGCGADSGRWPAAVCKSRRGAITLP